MSKNTEEKTKHDEVVKEINGTLESDDKAKEAIENLRLQLQEHLRLAENHKTMAIKAQGALEVLLQLHPQEENNENK